MSEATRAVALQHAVVHHAGKADAAAIVLTAATFHSFINGNEEAVPAPAKPATVARLAAAAGAKAPALTTNPKATAAKKPPAKSEDQLAQEAIDKATAEAEAGDGETGGATRDQIGKAVEDLLKANLRTGAVALLKKFGAKSVSEVPEESYDDFMEEANGLLLGA